MPPFAAGIQINPETQLGGLESKETLSKKNTPAKRCENNVGGTMFKIIPSARTLEK